tara:strand:- start:878 stop:1327 length:450 start_codon:yes stop_codon:yes gene_type:complete
MKPLTLTDIIVDYNDGDEKRVKWSVSKDEFSSGDIELNLNSKNEIHKNIRASIEDYIQENTTDKKNLSIAKVVLALSKTKKKADKKYYATWVVRFYTINGAYQKDTVMKWIDDYNEWAKKNKNEKYVVLSKSAPQSSRKGRSIFKGLGL